MSSDASDDRTPTAQCSTTGSFEPYGIEDGSDLIQRAARELPVPTSTDVTVTGGVLSATAAAYREAFRDLTGLATLPDQVSAAVDDAVVWTGGELGSESVDVRTTLVPTFYTQLAGFHCAYRKHHDDRFED